MTRQPSTIGSVAINTTTQKVLASLGCLAMASIALLPMTSRASLVEGRVICFSDRPCIETATVNEDSIQIFWRNNVGYDFYKVRWSRSGKDEKDVQVAGGQTGSLALTGVTPKTHYTFKIKGCNGEVIGGPVCSEWEVQDIVTGEGVASSQPSPEQSPVSAPTTTAPSTTAPSTPPSSETPSESQPPGKSPSNAAPLNSPPLETAPATTPAPPSNQPSSTEPAPAAPPHVVPITQ